jgi:paraquat-inducible protein A
LIVCHACDLVQRRTVVTGRTRSRCARCAAELERANSTPLDTAIALALTAFVLLLLSNFYPLVTMHLGGATRSATFLAAGLGLYAQGYAAMAVLIVFTTMVAPFIQVLAWLYVLISLRRRRRAVGEDALFRTLIAIRSWSMLEVFMLGALVAFVKLMSYADISPGIAIFSCILLIMTIAALNSVATAGQFWRWVEGSRG